MCVCVFGVLRVRCFLLVVCSFCSMLCLLLSVFVFLNNLLMLWLLFIVYVYVCVEGFLSTSFTLCNTHVYMCVCARTRAAAHSLECH